MLRVPNMVNAININTFRLTCEYNINTYKISAGEAVSNSDYIALNECNNVNNELDTMCKWL
jgi:hypothetical protein